MGSTLSWRRPRSKGIAGDRGRKLDRLAGLVSEIRTCTVCAQSLPHGPRPVLRVGTGRAPILLVGQAPGMKVHASGIPWDDASGERLRNWLGVDKTRFYDEDQFAIMPMGFCYPGRKGGGDAPPRPECAPLWHDRVLAHLPRRRLTLLIGAYAQARYLPGTRGQSLTGTVAAWRTHAAKAFMPLVHPSPRNIRWFKANPWFEAEIVPELRSQVKAALAGG